MNEIDTKRLDILFHYSPLILKTWNRDKVREDSARGDPRGNPTSTLRGFRRLPERIHRLPEGFHRLPEGFHRLPEGFRRLPEGFHRLPKGFRRLPEGFHRARLLNNIYPL